MHIMELYKSTLRTFVFSKNTSIDSEFWEIARNKGKKTYGLEESSPFRRANFTPSLHHEKEIPEQIYPFHLKVAQSKLI